MVSRADEVGSGLCHANGRFHRKKSEWIRSPSREGSSRLMTRDGCGGTPVVCDGGCIVESQPAEATKLAHADELDGPIALHPKTSARKGVESGSPVAVYLSDELTVAFGSAGAMLSSTVHPSAIDSE